MSIAVFATLLFVAMTSTGSCIDPCTTSLPTPVIKGVEENFEEQKLGSISEPTGF